MPFEILTGVYIREGEALTDPIDCSGGDPVRLTMPADWTPANITLQMSTDGLGFNDVFEANGAEVMIVATPGAAVLIPEHLARAIVFLRLRSGRRGHEIPQEAQREFAIQLRTAGP